MCTSVPPRSCTFGERLRAVRTDRGVGKSQLARMIMVPFGSISRFEDGRSMPMLMTVMRIALALNVEPCELFAGVRAAA